MSGSFASPVSAPAPHRNRWIAPLPQIAQLKVFQGNNYIDNIFFGESVYGPLHDPMFLTKSNPTPAQLALWRKNHHRNCQGRPASSRARGIGRYDRRISRSDRSRQQRVSGEKPSMGAGSRQSLQPRHLARMKELGMYAAVNPWAVINGAINHRIFEDSATICATEHDSEQRRHVGLWQRWKQSEPILRFSRRYGGPLPGKMVGARKSSARQSAVRMH